MWQCPVAITFRIDRRACTDRRLTQGGEEGGAICGDDN